MLADRQEREQRELRRRAREQKRLELGDEYLSSDTEESCKDSENEDSYGEDTYDNEIDLQTSLHSRQLLNQASAEYKINTGSVLGEGLDLASPAILS